MNNETVKRAVERADKWIEYKNRVELIRITKDGWERIASFPKENLTDENWNIIKCIPEVSIKLDKGDSDE